MSLFDEFNEIFKKLRKLNEKSSGYSISVVYRSDGRPIVNVETYGNIDKNKLKEEIKRMYPGAEIRGLERSSILEETSNRKETSFMRKPSKKRKELIWEVDEDED